MDEIQKALVKAGRKDLAQKYYQKWAVTTPNKLKQSERSKIVDAISKEIGKDILKKSLYSEDVPIDGRKLRSISKRIQKINDSTFDVSVYATNPNLYYPNRKRVIKELGKAEIFYKRKIKEINDVAKEMKKMK